MPDLKEIKEPIAEHLSVFEKKFRDAMKTRVALLNYITQYILRSKGKQMRPMFVFFSAGITGQINESTYHAASLIELLHTATLIHDDVVDDSNTRRGFFSINALWKNKIAVLVGDYLLSRGLLLALDNNEFELLRIVSNATREMSEGELLQIEKARRLNVQEEIYFEIIRKKTASLIASCCAAGAHSAGASPEIVSRMQQIGEYIGIAFQIKDDLFDYQQNNRVGKPNGIDIKEQKMTLPLIYMLNNSSFLEKRKVVNVVKYHNLNPDKVAGVIDKVNHSGGIEYATGKMLEYRDKAFALLAEFPETPMRRSFEQLIAYTTDRSR
ncbi:MAG TPA: polyprenyl synthetase family protein [Bacteroidales bacterium]|nr:polyprenyl synthetase family protein [Bacteroidales bacterium]